MVTATLENIFKSRYLYLRRRLDVMISAGRSMEDIGKITNYYNGGDYKPDTMEIIDGSIVFTINMDIDHVKAMKILGANDFMELHGYNVAGCHSDGSSVVINYN